ASKLDFPTPSGPIRPVIPPAGTSRSTPARAIVLPYSSPTLRRLATKSLAGRVCMGSASRSDDIGADIWRQLGGPFGICIDLHPGDAGQASLDVLQVLFE